MCFRPPSVDSGPLNCPKCGGEVEPVADKCPHCGATAESPSPGIPTMSKPGAIPAIPKAPGAPKPPAPKAK